MYIPGDFVKIGPWCGAIIDVLTSSRQTVLEIDFVKNAQRGRKTEFVSLSGRLNITLVDKDELQQEFAKLIEMQRAFFDRLIGDKDASVDDATKGESRASVLRCDKSRGR